MRRRVYKPTNITGGGPHGSSYQFQVLRVSMGLPTDEISAVLLWILQ